MKKAFFEAKETVIIKKKSGESRQVIREEKALAEKLKPWKVLIVDDEDDIHKVTELCLSTLEFEGRPIELLSAHSGEEGYELCKNHPDLALALIDVVMETDHAGLDLVRKVRGELNRKMMRLYIRTGQPGLAPEKEIIDTYDIDDYKEKTDLTAQKLYTAVRAGLKGYRDLLGLDKNRKGLKKILSSAANLYQPGPLAEFFEGVLLQLTGLLNIDTNSLITSCDACLLSEASDNKPMIWAGTGRFQHWVDNKASLEWMEKIIATVDQKMVFEDGQLVIPLRIKGKTEAVIYIETPPIENVEDLQLIEVMALQCESAFVNLKLFNKLEGAKKCLEDQNLFIGMAAHDLRNPIGSVISMLNILPDELPEMDPATSDLLNDISQSCEGALELLDDLLDISRFESGLYEVDLLPLDISHEIEAVVSMMQRQANLKKIKIAHEKNSSPVVAMIDTQRINRVLVNLVSNAIKYSKADTTVRIELLDVGQEIEVHVIDEGIGIPEKEQNKIFEAFCKTTSKPTAGESSTGLGLVICKKVVEAHGGKIWFESVQGKGSNFKFTLKKPS